LWTVPGARVPEALRPLGLTFPMSMIVNDEQSALAIGAASLASHVQSLRSHELCAVGAITATRITETAHANDTIVVSIGMSSRGVQQDVCIISSISHDKFDIRRQWSFLTCSLAPVLPPTPLSRAACLFLSRCEQARVGMNVRCECLCVCVCVRARAYACTWAWPWVCSCARVCVCVCVCVCGVV
jgi:hypothetical protein